MGESTDPCLWNSSWNISFCGITAIDGYNKGPITQKAVNDFLQIRRKS